MLLDIQRNLVFSAPTQIGCIDLTTSQKKLTNLLVFEATELLEEYVKVSTAELLYHVVII